MTSRLEEELEHQSIDWADLSLEKRCKLIDDLTNIYVSFQSIALGDDNPKKINPTSKSGAPTKNHDAISTMIKIKIISLIDTDCPWATMNNIIHYIKKKGGKYSSVTRDTVDRRINHLIEEGVIEKINTDILTEIELGQISHNRTFNFVYRASDSYTETLKNLKGYRPAPLNGFISYITEFISHLPEEQRIEIGKRIANVSLN